MICLVMTSLIVISCYSVASLLESENISAKLLLTSVIACSFVVLSELALGFLGVLSPLTMVAVQSPFIVATLCIAGKKRHGSFAAVIAADFSKARFALHRDLDRYNVILCGIVLLTYGWIFLSAIFLPTRGVDDLAYHLPSIYDYIQSHKIWLLPVQLREHFAFPQNAELLFMWPILFSKSQQMITSINIPFVALSILAVYALLSHFDISGKDALFAALLYALCPVVIMQAGVNYIDIIVSLFVLASLYFAIRFHATGNTAFLYATGAAAGLLLGMKYTALALTLPAHLFVLAGLRKQRLRLAAGYALTVALLSGWWYVRNYVVLHNPFFPLHFFGSAPHAAGTGGFFENIVENSPHWVSRYLIDDIGVGTYDGGFGIVFWGIGFSSWLYYALYALLRPGTTGLTRFITLATLPLGFVLLLAVPSEFVRTNSRFAMFVIPIGFWSFFETMKVLDEPAGRALVKTCCILLSVLTLSLMFKSQQPTYDISEAVHDALNGKNPSKFKYLASALPSQVGLSFIWAPLDFITRNDRPGLNCFIMSDFRLFAPAPVYGSRLQNRVSYAYDESKEVIDAFVYTYCLRKENDLSHQTGSHREMPPDIMLSKTTSSYDVVASDDYLVVSQSNRGCLLLRKRIANTPSRKALLRDYYRDTVPGVMKVANKIAPILKEDIPVVTSNDIGYGLRYAPSYAHSSDRIVVTPVNMEETVATRRQFTRCYTLGRPLEGYSAIKVSSENQDNVVIYLNWKG